MAPVSTSKPSPTSRTLVGDGRPRILSTTNSSRTTTSSTRVHLTRSDVTTRVETRAEPWPRSPSPPKLVKTNQRNYLVVVTKKNLGSKTPIKSQTSQSVRISHRSEELKTSKMSRNAATQLTTRPTEAPLRTSLRRRMTRTKITATLSDQTSSTTDTIQTVGTVPSRLTK